MCPFKKGDILTPKVERAQSNYFKLEKVVKVQVLSVNSPSSRKSYLTVRMVEGNAYSAYDGSVRVGATFGIYADAFQLEGSVEPRYQVW